MTNWFAQHGLMNPLQFQRMTPQQRMAQSAPGLLSGLGANTLVMSGTRLAGFGYEKQSGSAVTVQSLTPYTDTVDPCGGVVCAPGSHCSNGACVPDTQVQNLRDANSEPTQNLMTSDAPTLQVSPSYTGRVFSAPAPMDSSTTVSAPTALRPTATLPTRHVEDTSLYQSDVPSDQGAPQDTYNYPTGKSVSPNEVALYDDGSGGVISRGTEQGGGGGGGAAATPQAAAMAASQGGAGGLSSIPTWAWVVGAVGLGYVAMKMMKK